MLVRFTLELSKIFSEIELINILYDYHNKIDFYYNTDNKIFKVDNGLSEMIIENLEQITIVRKINGGLAYTIGGCKYDSNEDFVNSDDAIISPEHEFVILNSRHEEIFRKRHKAFINHCHIHDCKIILTYEHNIEIVSGNESKNIKLLDDKTMHVGMNLIGECSMFHKLRIINDKIVVYCDCGFFILDLDGNILEKQLMSMSTIDITNDSILYTKNNSLYSHCISNHNSILIDRRLVDGCVTFNYKYNKIFVTMKNDSTIIIDVNGDMIKILQTVGNPFITIFEYYVSYYSHPKAFNVINIENESLHTFTNKQIFGVNKNTLIVDDDSKLILINLINETKIDLISLLNIESFNVFGELLICENKIIIKDKKRNIVYIYNLDTNVVEYKIVIESKFTLVDNIF